MDLKEFLRRIGQIIIVLIGVSFFTFLLVQLAPGDPVMTMYQSMGIIPTEEVLNETREAMGLNDPFFVQYFRWLANVLKGDLGTSYSKYRPVASLLAGRMWPTLKLSISSMFVMLLFAVPLGMISAVYSNKPIDYIVRVITFFGVSMPNFWVGLLLLYFLAMKLNLLPVISTDPNALSNLVLPTLTLAFAMTAKYTRQVRTAVLEELHKDYVIGAKGRGESERSILFKHVFPNSLLPLVTMFGLSLGSLLGGTSVVEVIFTYPGLGSLAIDAIKAMDYPLIQGYVLWISLIYMAVNLAVDISYNFIDPRIKGEGKA